jgi:hypothetical protein
VGMYLMFILYTNYYKSMQITSPEEITYTSPGNNKKGRR